MLLYNVRIQVIFVRFLAGHLIPSEASAVKVVTLVGLCSGTVKTLTLWSEMKQLDDEMMRTLVFGGWIGERCVQLLKLLERKIEGGTGPRLP